MKKALLAGIGTFMLISTLSMPSASAAPSEAYTQAEKSGNILAGKTKSYQQAILTNKLSVINNQYGGLSEAIKSTEILIGKVPGSSSRSALIKKYVMPAKVEKERTIYEVSQYRLLEAMESRIFIADYKIDGDLSKLNRLKTRAVQIKKSGGYKPLSPSIPALLIKKEAVVEGEYTATYVDGYKILVNKDENIYYANNMYDYLRKHLMETEKRIGQVSGSTTRDDLTKLYVQPGKKEIERTMYEITRHRLMNQLFVLAQSNQIEKVKEAKARLPELQELKKKADAIREKGGYAALPAPIMNDLADDEKQLTDDIEKALAGK